ncbi:MAG: hypothetical protein R6W78_05740 [Bacteroidales bacterium]
MKRLLIILFLISTLTGYSQIEINVNAGDFSNALDSALKIDKKILLITGNNYCGYYLNFVENVLSDSTIISYMNSEFITLIFRADKADKEAKKKMKKYNKSWPGWPQFYVLDSNEKLIADFSYPKYTSNEQFLKILQDYLTIEEKWLKLKKISKKELLSLDQLKQYIVMRDLNYSSFGDIHINRQVSKYINGLNNQDRFKAENWFLFKRYINMHDLGLDKSLFDFVAKNKKSFQMEIGEQEVSDYLAQNYQNDINWRKPEKVKKIAEKYPYNTISEAKKAIELYWTSKKIQGATKSTNIMN